MFGCWQKGFIREGEASEVVREKAVTDKRLGEDSKMDILVLSQERDTFSFLARGNREWMQTLVV